MVFEIFIQFGRINEITVNDIILAKINHHLEVLKQFTLLKISYTVAFISETELVTLIDLTLNFHGHCSVGIIVSP